MMSVYADVLSLEKSVRMMNELQEKNRACAYGTLWKSENSQESLIILATHCFKLI